MTHKQTRRGLVVGVCLLAIFGAGCTPAEPSPTPPSSNVSSPTPLETAQEREERLGYAAAEASYRDFRAEYRSVLDNGGAAEATDLMKSTASGPYLSEALEVLRAYRGLEQHSSGVGRIVYIHQEGYSSNSLTLRVCEDTTQVQIFDKEGKLIGHGEQREAELDVRQSNGSWKLWSGRGRRVTSCSD